MVENILHLFSLEPGIHRNEDGPDIGQGKYGLRPLDPVGQPNRYFIPRFHSGGQQSPGEPFDPLEELPVSYPLAVDYQEFAVSIKTSGFFHRETDRYRDPGTQGLFLPMVRLLYTLSYKQI